MEWPEFEDGIAIWPKRKEPHSMTDIPKQELLLKLLRMTESSHDAECLTAIRKANEFLKSAGWDWEKLIHAKIKIIEDPFKNLGTPQGGGPSRYASAPQPKTAPPPPPPKPKPTVKMTWPIGINPNKFAGFCYCCGVEVLAQQGLIFKPYQFNSAAVDDWKVVCQPCNTTATIGTFAASRRASTNAKGKAKPFVSDLS